jgi:hypothetical protein
VTHVEETHACVQYVIYDNYIKTILILYRRSMRDDSVMLMMAMLDSSSQRQPQRNFEEYPANRCKISYRPCNLRVYKKISFRIIVLNSFQILVIKLI